MQPGRGEEGRPADPRQHALEVVWTALPAVLIIGLCTYAYTVLRANEDQQGGRDDRERHRAAVRVRVLLPRRPARQSSRPTCTSPKGQPVVFKLRSLDVIHSFFVPEFSEKLDAVPGITTTLRVTPTRLGNYPAECTELCGAGHSLMRASRARRHAGGVPALARDAKAERAAADRARPPPNDTQPGVPGSSSSSGATASSSSSSSGAASSSSTSTARVAAPPARPCSPAPAGCGAATRWRPPARPARSGRTSMSGCGPIAPPASKKDPGRDT